jgi:predicted O-methyltransferase YrrM
MAVKSKGKEKLDLLQVSNDTFGWLLPDEANELYSLAKEVKADGSIVEIGSFVGKSTIAIAAGNADGGKREFYTIDTHEGNPEHTQAGQPYFDGSHMTTHTALLENLAKAGLSNHVHVLKEDALKIGQTWLSAIAMLFVDTAHDYDTTRNTLELWNEHVSIGGVVAIHDYKPFAGAVDDWLEAHPEFERVKQVETMLVTKRVR